MSVTIVPANDIVRVSATGYGKIAFQDGWKVTDESGGSSPQFLQTTATVIKAAEKIWWAFINDSGGSLTLANLKIVGFPIDNPDLSADLGDNGMDVLFDLTLPTSIANKSTSFIYAVDGLPCFSVALYGTVSSGSPRYLKHACGQLTGTR